MGGHAFANTSRLSYSDLVRIRDLVLQLLKTLGCPEAASPLELADKNTFGDVDVVYVPPLYVMSGDHVEQHAFDEKVCMALGSPEPPSINGNTRSYLTRERFQVDLICSESTDTFPATNAFFSHGDLSTIMGNELSFWGLKLGMDGLSLDLSKLDLASTREGESKFTISKDLGRVWLSGDVGSIYKFLCLPAVLFDGSTRLTLNEMVAALIASPFFNPFRKERAASKSKHQQEVKRPAWAALSAACLDIISQDDPDQLLHNFPSGHPLHSLQWISKLTSRRPPHTSEEFWMLHTFCADYFSRRFEFNERCRIIRCCHERWLHQRSASSKFSGATLMSWYPELCQNKGRKLEQIRQAVREHVLCVEKSRMSSEESNEIKTAVFYGVASEDDCLFQDWVLRVAIDTIKAIVDEAYTSILGQASSERKSYVACQDELASRIMLYANGNLP